MLWFGALIRLSLVEFHLQKHREHHVLCEFTLAQMLQVQTIVLDVMVGAVVACGRRVLWWVRRSCVARSTRTSVRALERLRR